MSVQKEGRKKEVKEANKHANDPGSDVDLWNMAHCEKASLFAENRFATIEAIFNDVGHREDVQGSVNHDFDPDGEDEKHECIVVLDTNTVINPWTVMIKPFNTLIAN